jgi:DNA-binding XRE family transcriptional regulator
MVIVARDGMVQNGPARLRAGETWEKTERQRLAFPLRRRRNALGLGQGELGRLVGVSRDSIGRWELTHVPPRPIALIVWAQRLECSVAIQLAVHKPTCG